MSWVPDGGIVLGLECIRPEGSAASQKIVPLGSVASRKVVVPLASRKVVVPLASRKIVLGLECIRPQDSELKKGQKRKSIAENTELDGFQSTSHQKADPSRQSSSIRKWYGIDLMPYVKFVPRKKRCLRSKVTKQREGLVDFKEEKIAEKKDRSDTSIDKVAEEAMVRSDQNGHSSITTGSSSSEFLKCEEIKDNNEGILSLGVAEKEETDTSKINAEEESPTATPKNKVSGGANASKVENIEEVDSVAIDEMDRVITEGNITEQMECDVGIKAGSKRITRSDVSEQREEAPEDAIDETEANEGAAPTPRPNVSKQREDVPEDAIVETKANEGAAPSSNDSKQREETSQYATGEAEIGEGVAPMLNVSKQWEEVPYDATNEAEIREGIAQRSIFSKQREHAPDDATIETEANEGVAPRSNVSKQWEDAPKDATIETEANEGDTPRSNVSKLREDSLEDATNKTENGEGVSERSNVSKQREEPPEDVTDEAESNDGVAPRSNLSMQREEEPEDATIKTEANEGVALGSNACNPREEEDAINETEAKGVAPRSNVSKQREEALEDATDMIDANDGVALEAGQHGNSCPIREACNTKQIKNREEIESEKKLVGKRITRSCTAKKIKPDGTDNKKVADGSVGFKDYGEECAHSPVQNGNFSVIGKSDSEEGKIEKKRSMKSGIVKQMGESEPFCKEVIELSDAETATKKPKVDPIRCRREAHTRKKGNPELGKGSRVSSSGQKRRRNLEDDDICPIDVKRKGFDSSTRLGGLIKALSSKKKKSHKRRNSHEAKMGSNRNDADSSNDIVLVNGESRSTSKKILLSNPSEGRSVTKQKLRDKLKDILMNAGWKIDLRPRASKNYADSVYISPEGCSHWSITKAYRTFESQLKISNVGKGNGSRVKSTKGSDNNGTSSQISLIPVESLSILQRIVVNKRRRRKEIDEGSNKLKRHIRNRKSKSTIGTKNTKQKHFKKNTKLGSSSKSIVGHKRNKPHQGKSREKRKGIALLVRGSSQQTANGHLPYPLKQTIFSWMIGLEIFPATRSVKYMNRKSNRTMLQGWITRNGIHCSCCSKIITVSQFEIHAGSKQRRPYRNIYVEGGVSLLQCQIEAWKKQDESARKSFYSIGVDGEDPNDDTCGICGDGGDLICCDSCPSTFHLVCLDIQMLPPGDWHCMNCSCRVCGLYSCIGSQDEGLNVSPLLCCSQCEEKYHQKCVLEEETIPDSSDLPCLQFCGQNCKKIFEELQRLLGVKNDLEPGFSWTVLQRFDENIPESVCGLDRRVECNSKIALALTVMDECFLPIIDQRSGINLIRNVVYNCGSNFSRLNYRGFYTFLLERDDEVICVASLRIHGTKLAEMPFIGTRNMYRRQGMCRRLLNGIESALRTLNIEKLIIPAISELRDTWTNVFGFKTPEVSQKQELRSSNILVFPGTGILLKPLLTGDSSEDIKASDKEDKIQPCSEDHNAPEIENEPTLCSSICVEPDASNEATEIKGMEPGLEVSPESSDAPHGSDLFFHDEPIVSNISQVDYSLEPEIKLPGEENMHGNNEAITGGIEPDVSNEAVVLCEQKTGYTDLGTEISPESLQASNGSGLQASDILLDRKVINHEEHLEGKDIQAGPFLESEIKFHGENHVDENADSTIGGSCVIKNTTSVHSVSSDSKAPSLDASDPIDADQSFSENTETPLSISPEKEKPDFCLTSDSHDANVTSFGAVSEHSEGGGAIQNDPRMQQKPPESQHTDKLHHGKVDLANNHVVHC